MFRMHTDPITGNTTMSVTMTPSDIEEAEASLWVTDARIVCEESTATASDFLFWASEVFRYHEEKNRPEEVIGDNQV